MKKIILLFVVLMSKMLISSAEPKGNGVLNSAYYGKHQGTELIQFLLGDLKIPAKEFHLNRKEVVEIYRDFLAQKFPGVPFEEVLNNSTEEDPDGNFLSDDMGFIGSAKNIGWFHRKPYPGERVLRYKGIAWASSYCWNPINGHGGKFTISKPSDNDDFDQYFSNTTASTNKRPTGNGGGNIVVINNNNAQQPQPQYYQQYQQVQPQQNVYQNVPLSAYVNAAYGDYGYGGGYYNGAGCYGQGYYDRNGIWIAAIQTAGQITSAYLYSRMAPQYIDNSYVNYSNNGNSYANYNMVRYSNFSRPYLNQQQVDFPRQGIPIRQFQPVDPGFNRNPGYRNTWPPNGGGGNPISGGGGNPGGPIHGG